MNLSELYNYAENRNIEVVNWRIDNTKGCAIKFEKNYHILLNDSLIDSEREERLVLAHELGHCRSDRMYYLEDFNNPLYKQNIAKAERKACNEACRLLVKPKELKNALCENDTEYAAAESLDLDIFTFREIIEYYRTKGII